MIGWRRRVLMIGVLAAGICIGLLVLEHAYFEWFDVISEHVYCGEDDPCPAWTERGLRFLVTRPLAYIFLAAYPLLTAPGYVALGAIGIGSGLSRRSGEWLLALAGTSVVWAVAIYAIWTGIRALRHRRRGT